VTTPGWPLFGLVVRTPTLELRYPTDELLDELGVLSTAPIHAPETMPFAVAWTDAPPAERIRQGLQHHWRSRAEWTADHWVCPLVTIVGGEVVGSQALHADNFSRCRTVNTGSWLTMSRQGGGIGTEMRAAALHLAFAGLGADRCESGAFEDNAASQGVSRKLGYVENGDAIHARRDGAGRMIRLLLTRHVWERNRRDDIEIDGLDACRDLFGAAPADQLTGAGPTSP
jgi:RimJ/RimL family protein N-acetyltransferase